MSNLALQAASEELKQLIRERVGFTTYDCDTFLNVKCHAIDHLKGGGNIVMTIGLFAVVNFLAKVYRHLIEPAAFVTEEDVKNVKQAGKHVQAEVPHLKGLVTAAKTGWKPPPLHGVDNEALSFVKMVNAIRGRAIDLGLATPQDAQNVWRTFSNRIAHMAWPSDGSVGSYLFSKGSEPTFGDAQGIVRLGKPSFFKQDGQWVCNADRLNLDVRTITEWLCSEVDETANAENVQGTLQWIKEQ